MIGIRTGVIEMGHSKVTVDEGAGTLRPGEGLLPLLWYSRGSEGRLKSLAIARLLMG